MMGPTSRYSRHLIGWTANVWQVAASRSEHRNNRTQNPSAILNRDMRKYEMRTKYMVVII